MTDKITIERETLERTIAYLEAPTAKLWPAGTLHGITASLRAALAAQQAEPQEHLTDSYVQQVPDKCDRIVWRNRYYSLPPAPAAQVAKERERCAKVCEAEDVASTDDAIGVQQCIAAAIRAGSAKS